MRVVPTLAVLVALQCAGLLSATTPASAEEKTAIFAGGCFWCIEKDFEHVKGVKDVVSGYAGGNSNNPTYKNHIKDGHLEVVRITYDDQIVSYSQLLDTFWRTVDPTDAGGQFCDRGNSYTTAVFALNGEQRKLAKSSKAQAADVLGSKIVTPIRDAAPFYEAEGYHQNYYVKNPARYKYYRWACGGDKRVMELWGAEAYKGVTKGNS